MSRLERWVDSVSARKAAERRVWALIFRVQVARISGMATTWNLEMNEQLIQRIWRRCKVGQLFNYSPWNVAGK
jgi:hypothetical protein